MQGKQTLKGLFNVGAAGSGVVMLLVMTAWVRSYFALDEVYYQRRGDEVLHSYVAGWGKGYFGFLARAANQPADFHVHWQSWPARRIDAGWGAGRDEVFDLLGVAVYTDVDFVRADVEVRMVTAYAPCWLAALLSAGLPAVWVMRWLGRRRVARRRETGHCVRCGYDLRATSDRCPECGHAHA